MGLILAVLYLQCSPNDRCNDLPTVTTELYGCRKGMKPQGRTLFGPFLLPRRMPQEAHICPVRPYLGKGGELATIAYMLNWKALKQATGYGMVIPCRKPDSKPVHRAIHAMPKQAEN